MAVRNSTDIVLIVHLDKLYSRTNEMHLLSLRLLSKIKIKGASRWFYYIINRTEVVQMHTRLAVDSV